jgi:hypothetical protein
LSEYDASGGWAAGDGKQFEKTAFFMTIKSSVSHDEPV